MYYFSEKNIRGNHAGTKARNDAEAIFALNNLKVLNRKQLILTSDENENIYSSIKNRFDYFSYFNDINKIKNETVIIQYPMLMFDKQKEYFERIRRKNNLILLVHDIHSMRRGDEEGIKREIEILNLANGVILHNRFMNEKLGGYGLKTERVYLLQVFDYIYQGSYKNHSNDKGVAFAGNLDKSLFLRDLFIANKDTEFHLYGKTNQSFEVSNAKYYGSILPDELPGKLTGEYGLVWDGESIISSMGTLGEYTRYNNPHKLSLYLAAGLPVIVWKEAAVAEFVREKQVGICVERIDQINNLLSSVSKNDYKMMVKNVSEIQSCLVNGQFLGDILDDILADFD